MIDGAGHKVGFASSDSGNGRIFRIDGASEVQMFDLALENGFLYSSSSGRYGGAIYIEGSSTLEMTTCTLSTNKVHSVSLCRSVLARYYFAWCRVTKLYLPSILRIIE